MKVEILMTLLCGFKLGLEWLPLPSLELNAFAEMKRHHPMTDHLRKKNAGFSAKLLTKLCHFLAKVTIFDL
jgi:hypothetical protein